MIKYYMNFKGWYSAVPISKDSNPGYERGWPNIRFYKSLVFNMFFAIFFVFCCLLTGQAEGAKAWIDDIKIEDLDSAIEIDARLKGAFNEDIIEAISSGAVTRFKFIIDLKKDRGFWFDKTLESYEIFHTVTYDVLKKEFTIIKSFPDGHEENLSTSEWDLMEEWMTRLDSVQLTLPEKRDKDAEYFLRLKAEMKCIKIPFPLNYLLLFLTLWNFDTPWVRVPFKPPTNLTFREKRLCAGLGLIEFL